VNREIALKWAEELESDKYKQGRLKLYEPGTDKYCCLGVLNCVLGRAPEDLDIYVSEPFDEIFGHGVAQFWNLNDSQGATFKQIAAYIRSKVNET
jgi:hypothetical protein